VKVAAAVLERTGGPLSVTEVELAPPGAGEVLVCLGRPRAACATSASATCRSSVRPIPRDVPFAIAGDRAGARGRLPLEQLISHRLPLEQVEHAFELLRSGSALRSVLDLGTAA
jgi:Zn-dependent alcohol dehydrogenase